MKVKTWRRKLRCPSQAGTGNALARVAPKTQAGVPPDLLFSPPMNVSKRLRIAVAVNFLPTPEHPHRGRANYQRVKALARLADVRAFCVEPWYMPMGLLWPRKAPSAGPVLVHQGEGAIAAAGGAIVESLRYRALPFLSRTVNGRAAAKVLTPRIRDFGPDVVIGYFVYPIGFGALQAGRRLGVPTIIGAVGSDLRQTGRWTRQLAAQALQNAEFVVAVSEELRQRAIAMGAPPERCRTVHNACDAGIFHRGNRAAARAQLQVEERAELMLFVGSLKALKGVRELLEATALVAARRPNLQIVCIGEGPLEGKLRQRASNADLAEHVRFIGGALPDEVAHWLTAANVFCLPSHSEGCSNVVIEALSCGRPVVATDVGGTPELVNSKSAILVPSGNVGRLATGLVEALDRVWNEEDIVACSSRSWEDWAKEMYEVCEQAVRHSGTADRSAPFAKK